MKHKKVLKTEELIANAEQLNVDPNAGLDEEQVLKRKKAGLINQCKRRPTKTYWQIFTDNFFNFFNVILFFVFALMLIAGLSISHYFFMLILVANMAIGIGQDIHARHLVDRLTVVTNPKATVVRNGKESVIDANEVVLSDIIIFKAGEQIYVDSKVINGECFVDESLLTGESVAVKKVSGDTLLSGTFLIRGSVKATAIKVGAANYAESLEQEASAFSRPKSEIRRSVSTFMTFTGVFALFVAICTYFTYGFQGKGWGNFFFDKEQIASLSGSMVALLPAGMFLLTSVALAVGVINLSKKRMVVQELYCIEMLARVDMLCLDKTGTLTDGKMSVYETIAIDGHSESEIASMVAAVLHYSRDTNATAVALKNKFGDECSEASDDVRAFDSELKYSAVSLHSGMTFAFGAAGFVPTKPLGHELEEKINSYADRGMRVLVVSSSAKPMEKSKAPNDMDAVGLIVLSDHIKDDAAANIAWFQSNDVAVRVISGDDPRTVSEIAKQVGVNNAGKYVSLEGKSLDETKALASDYVIFGRANPEQKAALINAFKESGHKVAMTGDGVNDILALKVADCSIAMASGSSAARNVSHLVSLDNDFSKLPDVVKQGRRVINNLQRSCSLFLNKTFFAFIVTVVFMISMWCGGRTYPFSTANMIVWEVFGIGLPAFFLALQPSDERLRGTFLGNIFAKAGPAGFIEALSALLPLMFFVFWPESYTHCEPGSDEAFRVAVTMSVLLFTVISYAVLFRVCYPFTKYRFVVFILSLIGGVGLFGIDARHGQRLISISYSGLTWGFSIVLACIAIVCVAIYFVIDYLIRKRFKDDSLKGGQK